MTPPVSTLIQITDTHLLADPEGRQAGWRTQASLDAVIADIHTRYQPDALIATGDLVHDESPEGYRRLARQMRNFGVPALALPGNHDDPHTLAAHMSAEGIQVTRPARLGGWQILLLDDHRHGEDGGHLPEAELQRLQDCLAGCNAPALVALHHPPVPVGSHWLDAIGLDNAGDLFAVLRRFPQVRVVTCGHIHQEFDIPFQDLRILATPSTCRQFKAASRDFAVDELKAPGYRVMWLGQDGSFSTQVHRVPAAQAALHQTLIE